MGEKAFYVASSLGCTRRSTGHLPCFAVRCLFLFWPCLAKSPRESVRSSSFGRLRPYGGSQPGQRGEDRRSRLPLSATVLILPQPSPSVSLFISLSDCSTTGPAAAGSAVDMHAYEFLFETDTQTESRGDYNASPSAYSFAGRSPLHLHPSRTRTFGFSSPLGGGPRQPTYYIGISLMSIWT